LEAGANERLHEDAEVRFGTVEMVVKTVTVDEDTQGAAPRSVPLSEEVPAGATRIIDLVAGKEVADSQHVGEPAPDEPPPAPTTMTAVEGPTAGQSVSLSGLPLVLGREGAEGAVGIDDRFISRSHVRVDRTEDGAVRVTDLGSTNGSWLNDDRLDPDSPQPVGPGDKLRMGPATVVEFQS
ncbi:MAG: FHA domain-containing protein, partial [Actinomycetota bacterium]|nr:FHA domain-containing protein [Actinomycetota bacterium]